MGFGTLEPTHASIVRLSAHDEVPSYRGESKKTEIPIPQGYFSLALIGILLQMKCLRNQNNLYQKNYS